MYYFGEPPLAGTLGGFHWVHFVVEIPRKKLSFPPALEVLSSFVEAVCSQNVKGNKSLPCSPTDPVLISKPRVDVGAV